MSKAHEIIMEVFGSHTHSFVIKIWLEETAEEAGFAVWRGHITHVTTGERRYLKELSEIPAFILPHVETMGIKPDRVSQLREWLKRLMFP